MTKHFRSNIWRVKGFISNYGELRYFLDTGLVETNTEQYLKNMIDDAFDRAKIDKPYFLMGGAQLNCGYNLYGNMKANKTILLVDRIGYDYKSLVALCKQVGINSTDANGKRRGYGTLVRDYLIKIWVGTKWNETARLPLPFRNICRSYVLNTMSFFSKADFSIVPDDVCAFLHCKQLVCSLIIKKMEEKVNGVEWLRKE